MGYYQTAQICTNGHIITGNYDISNESHQNFCDKCGSETITSCPNCNSKIRGHYKVEGVAYLGSSMKSPPSYCYNCGKPYPWTESSLKSAQELLELEDILSKEELNYFNENISSIIVDTPNSKVIATKLKIFISKASSTVGSALKDIIVEIGSETVKKIILNE